MSQTNRLAWLDNLRTLMIALVVSMHACVTYSHVGSWYFMISPEPTLAAKIPFAFYQGHLQAFFMGLLFFVSGYLADRSLARKTTKAFLGERFRRLGIPVLFYMLVIHPFIVFGLLTPVAERPSVSWFFSDYLGKGRFIRSSGPMWFAFALLLFCIPFAFFPRANALAGDKHSVRLTSVAILTLGVGLGLGSFIVRLWQPIGTSWINFQFCFFTQYVVVFVLGVWVSRRDSLDSLATSLAARRAGWLGLILGPVVLATFAIFAGSDLGKTPPPMNGGLNWEALALALWEQCTGVCLGLGTIALCHKRLAVAHPISTWLSDRSFGVYLFHAPILVALAIAMQQVRGNIYLMTVALTFLGCLLSFVVADVARRVPILKQVL